MAGFNFPNDPDVDDTFTPPGGPTWTWNGIGWVLSGDEGDAGSVAWADITDKPTTFPPELPIAQSGVTNLVTDQAAQDTAIAGKAPTVHTHAESDVTNLVTDLAGKEPTISSGTTAQYWRGDKSWQTLPSSGTPDWADITGKPSTFPPTVPIAQADITGLVTDQAAQDTAIAGKLAASSYTAADVLTKILTVDGAGSGLDADLLDGQSSAAFAAASHTHAQSDVTSLASDLALKANLASPTFTGDPKAPTATAGDNDTSIATTAFVTGAIATSDAAQTTALAAKQASDATLTALAAFNTNGLLTQTAADTFVGRTVTGTTNRITLTNGDGVSGNPTVDISTAYVGQATITTLGTITTGTWTGTSIAVANGGTGATTAATARSNLAVPNITVASSAPGSPATNDVWIDTT